MVLSAIGDCLLECSADVREKAAQLVYQILLTSKSEIPSLYQAVPKSFYSSMIQSFVKLNRVDCAVQLLAQLRLISDWTMQTLLEIGLLCSDKQDLWNAFARSVYQLTIPVEQHIHMIEQLVEKLEELWGNELALKCCILLLGLFTPYPFFFSS